MGFSAFLALIIPIKCIALILGCMSVVSWAVMLRAWLNFRQWRRNSAEFFRQYNKIEEMPSAFESRDPLSFIFQICIFEWNKCTKVPYEIALDRIKGAAKAAEVKWLASAQQDLAILGTIAAIAPCLGILGSTIGVMDTFAGLAVNGNKAAALLSAGIGNALFAATLGFFTGIPALWGFHQTSAAIELWQGEIYCFLEKVVTDLVTTRKV